MDLARWWYRKSKCLKYHRIYERTLMGKNRTPSKIFTFTLLLDDCKNITTEHVNCDSSMCRNLPFLLEKQVVFVKTRKE